MLKRFVIPALIIASAFGIMQWLGTFKKEQKRMPPPPFVRTVSTQVVRYASINPAIVAMGRVLAFERIELTPEVSGLILDNHFLLRKSRTFRKGEILMRIDSSQIHYAYSATVSDLQNALAGLLPELKTDLPEALSAWRTFFNNCSVASLPDLPKPQTEREKLLATRYNVYKLYYLARQQQTTLRKHTLHAPFSGTVETSSVYPASMARTGVAVATITRTDAIEIELALTEEQLPFIRAGMNATASIEGVTEPVHGTVNRVSNILDERMQTAAAFIRINGSAANGCKSGAYAEIAIAGAPLEHAVAIPRKAVHNKSFVYCIDHDTLIEKAVDIAYNTVDTTYVTGGLPEGVQLITEPLQDAVIGMAVQTEQQARNRRKRIMTGKTLSSGEKKKQRQGTR